MTTRDNAPPPHEWRPEPRHCGQLCFDPVCPVCGVTIPANIELGQE